MTWSSISDVPTAVGLVVEAGLKTAARVDGVERINRAGLNAPSFVV
jgi:hypothetical protein